MPIDSALITEFARSDLERAREIAERFRNEINAPIQGADEPPLMMFCRDLKVKYRIYEISNIEEKLKILLDLGADPNVTVPYIGSPLMYALANDLGLKFITLLIDFNADINLKDSKGDTALFIAVAKRRFEELRVLIDRGGNINHRNNSGHTVLTQEIRSQAPDLGTVNQLIELGADVNASPSLCTALRNSDRSFDIVEALIGHGADPNISNYYGESPLAVAASKRSCPLRILETLVQRGATIDSIDNQGRTPLMRAAEAGNSKAIRYLLSLRASVTLCDATGESALHACCKGEQGCAEIVPLLVNAGADINLRSASEIASQKKLSCRTPLMYAVRREDITKALMEFGPDLDLVDDEMRSALMHAVTSYDPDKKALIIKTLLAGGASINLVDSERNTALHLVAKAFHSTGEAVKVLLEFKADINAKNSLGETPLMICRSIKPLRYLLGCGADVDVVDDVGKTALIHHVEHYDSDTHLKVKLLLDAKCNPDIQDNEGKTALMYVARSDSAIKSLKILVEHGVNLDLLDLNGLPATAKAAADNLMALIQAGAKPSIFEGRQLESAIERDDIPLALLLLERGAKLKLRDGNLFRRWKGVLKKLAIANAEILRNGLICEELEVQEQVQELLAKFKGDTDVADESELPPVLRKSAWPPERSPPMQTVLPAERIAEIERSIDYFDGKIDWPEGSRESTLQDFLEATTRWKTRNSESATQSSQHYMSRFILDLKPVHFRDFFINASAAGDGEFVKWWNANAKVISQKVSIERWVLDLLARFGLDLLPSLLEVQRKSGRFAHALSIVDSPACARFMSAGLESSPVSKIACEWVLKYPETCVKGIIVDAVSKLGRRRSVAEHCLRFLASNGHRSVVDQVASQFGDDVINCVAGVFAQDDLVPAKLPKGPKFWSPDVYPKPRLKSNNKVLPIYAIETIARMMSVSNAQYRTPALEEVIRACDRKSLANFAWGAFEDWASKGKKDSEWIFDALTYFGDDDCARRLTPYIRNWPSENGIARARKGLEVLAAIGTDVALSQIQAISQKNRYQSVLASAQEMMKKIATSRALKPHQLEDRLVPDCGLANDGVIKLNYGTRWFFGSVNALLKPEIRDETGAVLKALPAPRTSDDKALAKQSSAAWSEFCREIKPVAKLQLERLELAMIKSRIWTGSDFKSLLVIHPLLQKVVKGLVWGIFPSKGKLSTTFMVSTENDFVDADGRLVKVSDGSKVGIVHPLSMDEMSLNVWGSLFATKRQLQPFAQLVRKTYRAHDDLGKNCFGLFGAMVPSKALKGLLAKGWSVEIGDAGWIYGFERHFSDGRASLGAEPGVHIDDYEISAKEQKIEVIVPDTLNPIDYSETIRELMVLKK